ncbi:pyocin knob domain-containing protein [Lachnospiraceae bacterium 48-42]
MAAWTYACKTIQGMDLDMKILSRPGIPLKITRGMTGAGKVNPTQLVSLTDVADPVQEVELHKIAEYPGENKVMLPVMLKNSGVTARYSMYQLGLYAEDPDKGEILYLILQSDGPEEVPAEDEMKDFTLEWYLTLSVSNTENVEIVLDETGHATLGDLAAVENRVAVIEEFNRNMTELSDKEVEDIFKWPEEADPDEGTGTAFLYFAKNSLRKLISLIKGHYVSSQRKINGKMLDRDITLTAEDVEAVPVIQKGAAGGVAELDGAGKVPAGQLPSYVDDVLEGYLSGGEFYKEATHKTVFAQESGKIYVDLPSGKTYRWGGSAYVVISETLALGETSGTAYRGDFGKAAFAHSQSAHAPANAEQNVQSDWNATNTTDDAFIKNKPESLPANGGNAATVNKHTVDSDVPADAKFTDTTYGSMRGATSSAAGIAGLVPAPSPGAGDRYLGADGTWRTGAIGPTGPTGLPGASAGFGTPTASVDNNTGAPSVEVIASGPNTAKIFNFVFKNLKGAKGDKGNDGTNGTNGTSAGFGTPTASVDNNTGTPSVEVTASGPNTAKIFNFVFKNLKGAKGDTPSLVNNLLATAAGYALDARQGKVLDDKITALNGKCYQKLHEGVTNYSYDYNCIAINNINLNNITETGLYFCTNTPSRPTGNNGFMLAISYANGSRGLQLYFPVNGGFWKRINTSGSWSAWGQISTI